MSPRIPSIRLGEEQVSPEEQARLLAVESTRSDLAAASHRTAVVLYDLGCIESSRGLTTEELRDVAIAHGAATRVFRSIRGRLAKLTES